MWRLARPLVAVPAMQNALASRFDRELPGKLWLKLDSELPISASIRARGGIYEVLKHAEDLALEAGLITVDGDSAGSTTPSSRSSSPSTRWPSAPPATSACRSAS